MSAKRHIKFITVLLLISLFLCPLLSVRAMAEDEKDKYSDTELSIDICAGYNSDIIIQSSYTPIYFTVNNNTGADIEGTAVITCSNYYGSYTNSNAYSVEIPVSVAAGVSKNYRTASLLLNSGNNLIVRLYDNKGVLLKTSKQDIQTNNSSDYLHIGYVTDDASEAQIIQRYNYTASNSYFFNYFEDIFGEALTPGCFPQNLYEMKQFGLIIIGKADFSASSGFSASEIQLIRDYIKDGGTVLISTGSDYSALSGFSEFFTDNRTPVVSKKTVDGLNLDFTTTVVQTPVESSTEEEYATEDKETYYDYIYAEKYNMTKYEYAQFSFDLGKQSVISFNDDRFTECWSLNDAKIYRHSSYNLYICNFDLASKNMLDYAESTALIVGLMDNAGLDFNKLESYSIPLVNKYGLEQSISKNPSVLIATLILTVFVFCGILLPFLLSKKKKKSRIFWAGVPICSVLCALILFSYSSVIHGFTPVANTVVIEELGESGTGILSYSTVAATSNGGTRKLSFSDKTCTYLGIQVYYSGNYSQASTVSYADGGWVKGDTADAWGTSYAYACSTDESAGNFDFSFSEEADGSISLCIQNNSGRDIFDCSAFIFGKCYILEDMKAGDSLTINNISMSYSSDDADDFINGLFGERFGLSEEKLGDELYSSSYSYYGYSGYQAYSYSDSSFLKTLRSKSISAYGEALALCSVCDDFLYEDIAFLGFCNDESLNVSINGRETKRGNVTHLVYEKCKTDNTDLDFPVSSQSDYMSLDENSSYGWFQNANDYSGSVTIMSGEKAMLVYSSYIPSTLLSDESNISFIVDTEGTGNFRTFAAFIENGNENTSLIETDCTELTLTDSVTESVLLSGLSKLRSYLYQIYYDSYTPKTLVNIGDFDSVTVYDVPYDGYSMVVFIIYCDNPGDEVNIKSVNYIISEN